MSHVAYPSFSLDCVKDVVRIVRARTVRDELPLFAKCVWSLTGTGLGATIGEPDEVPVFSAADVDDEALADCLLALHEVEDSQAFGAADGEEAIDPAVVMMLVQLAVQLIQKWLENRRQS